MQNYESEVYADIKDLKKLVDWFEKEIGTEYELNEDGADLYNDNNEYKGNGSYALFFDLTNKEVIKIREYEIELAKSETSMLLKNNDSKNIKKLYIAYCTDLHETYTSRECIGFYSSLETARESIPQDLTSDSKFIIVQDNMDSLSNETKMEVYDLKYGLEWKSNLSDKMLGTFPNNYKTKEESNEIIQDAFQATP